MSSTLLLDLTAAVLSGCCLGKLTNSDTNNEAGTKARAKTISTGNPKCWKNPCDMHLNRNVPEGEEDDFFALIRLKSAGNISSGISHSSSYLKLIIWLLWATVVLNPKRKGKAIPNKALLLYKIYEYMNMYMKSVTLLCYSQAIFKSYRGFWATFLFVLFRVNKWYTHRQCCCAVFILLPLNFPNKI